MRTDRLVGVEMCSCGDAHQLGQPCPKNVPERDHSEAKLRHRNDLARDVVQLWREVAQAGDRTQVDPFPQELCDALDRLAATFPPIQDLPR